MARPRLVAFAFGIVAAACARPDHKPAPLPPSPPSTTPRETPAAPPSVKVAILEAPSGNGNWGGTLEISPAPAALIGSCLRAGAAGWISVNVDTHYGQAATTSVVESSPDVTPEARECIRVALTGLHSELGAIRALLYITFSPP